jgi:hypothetical protein
MPKAPRTLEGKAQAFARRYTELVEALRQQGVPDQVARYEARLAATLVYLVPDYVNPKAPCPTCGRVDEL